MALTENQDVPSYYQDAYRKTLRYETIIEPASVYGIPQYGITNYSDPGKSTTRKRSPFSLPKRKTKKGKAKDEDYTGPSARQLQVRQAFKKSVYCFNVQPESGGAEPPDLGPRNRSWWYGQAGTEWYYNYFMRQTLPVFLAGQMPEWCHVSYLASASLSLYIDEYSDEGQLSDGTGCPIGSSAHLEGASHKFWRAAAAVSLDQWTLEKLLGCNSVQCVFTSYSFVDSSFDIEVFTQPSLNNLGPGRIADITAFGSAVYSYENKEGTFVHSFECKDYLIEQKNKENSFAWWGWIGSKEEFSDENNFNYIYGQNYEEAPLQFLIT